MILQGHFPCYVILQFVRHTSVTEVVCKGKGKGKGKVVPLHTMKAYGCVEV
jgi:hypothetical protein